MSSAALEGFIAQAVRHGREIGDPARCVLAPPMLDLIENAASFLGPQHYRSEPASYAGNLV